MAIVKIPAETAVNNRKTNPYARWGARGEENRVEPVAKPAFDVPFQLEQGEKIFTIGSCFARNVETELENRGFKVPMRDLFKTPEFEGHDLSLVNNFGTPSIYNEFAWAFGEETFDESRGFAEIRKDKWVDLQLVSSVRPAPIEEVRARREALTQATRALAECRVLIMTLGLVELWWDAETECYLNDTPLPSTFSKWPNRFELHVLDFEESHGYLSKAIDIAIKHGRPDLQVILTVSPVPLFTTHRSEDVLVANSYSKSVLRAAAEHIFTSYEQVTYFPSFESVQLSDRRLAWREDLVHVTREIVELNVQRMVNAYSGQSENEITLPGEKEVESEDPEAIPILDDARRARESGNAEFFAANESWSDKSEQFAIEHARHLHDTGKLRKARNIAAKWDGREISILRSQVEIDLGRFDNAITSIKPFCRISLKGNTPWQLLMKANQAKGDLEGVLEAERGWRSAYSNNPYRAMHFTAQVLDELGHTDLAIERMRVVNNHYDGEQPFVSALYARLLLKANKVEEARDVLDDVVCDTDQQRSTIEKVKARIEKRLKDAA